MSEIVEHGAGPPAAKPPRPRERILEAADDLFTRFGIRGVGVDAIAEAADTNKMTLYRHFPSKDDLVAAWLERLLAKWNETWARVETLPATDTGAQVSAFLDILGGCFDQIAERGCPFMNSLAELPAKDHPARRVLDDYKAMNRKRITRFFKKIGLNKPTETTEDLYILFDGAKAGVQDIGAARSRARFMRLAKALIEARAPKERR